MMLKKYFILVLFLPLFLFGQEVQNIQVGAFNMEWFPCKDDGEMMKQYNINLRRPPQGNATDIPAMFHMLKELDIELLGVVEIVDPAILEESAKKYLGESYKTIYAPSRGSQKIGFIYDSSVLELIGQPEIYAGVKLDPDSWLRPAFRAYFKVKSNGMDFNAIIAHLKAAPSGWKKRQRQWDVLKKILKRIPVETGDKDIVLMGDFNNVSKKKYNEFLPLMDRLDFYWTNSEIDSSKAFTSYWKPDPARERIEGSMIDQIFISADAKDEYVENSIEFGGMCAQGKEDFEGSAIPEYYEKISDHCPVFVTFRVDKDND